MLLVVRQPEDPAVAVGRAAGVCGLELVGERDGRASARSDRRGPRAHDAAADHEHVVRGAPAAYSAPHGRVGEAAIFNFWVQGADALGSLEEMVALYSWQLVDDTDGYDIRCPTRVLMVSIVRRLEHWLRRGRGVEPWLAGAPLSG